MVLELDVAVPEAQVKEPEVGKRSAGLNCLHPRAKAWKGYRGDLTPGNLDSRPFRSSGVTQSHQLPATAHDDPDVT